MEENKRISFDELGNEGLFYESDNSTISDDEDDGDTSYAVFALNVGKTYEGENIYQIFFSHDTEETFAEGWSMKPACNEHIERLLIDASMYEDIMEFKTDIKLDLAQNNCCFSMQDCRDNIVALAYENLDDAEEYPEPYRIVIHFGESKNEVIDKLIGRGIQYTIQENITT